jgi:hypothetical protein
MSDKRVIIIEPGDILMIRLPEGRPVSQAEAHQFGAAMKMLDIDAIVVDGDFKLKKISREELLRLKELSDGKACSRPAAERQREPGDAVPDGEPDRGKRSHGSDRQRDRRTRVAAAGDSDGYLVHDRRSVQ